MNRRQFITGAAALAAAGPVVASDNIPAVLSRGDFWMPASGGFIGANEVCYNIGDIVRVMQEGRAKYYACVMTGTGKTAAFDEIGKQS